VSDGQQNLLQGTSLHQSPTLRRERLLGKQHTSTEYLTFVSARKYDWSFKGSTPRSNLTLAAFVALSVARLPSTADSSATIRE
jgi:hypothetical protein